MGGSFLRSDWRRGILVKGQIDEDLGHLVYMCDRNPKGCLETYDDCVCARLMEFRRRGSIVGTMTSQSVPRKTEVDIDESKRRIYGGLALGQLMLRLEPWRLGEEGEMPHPILELEISTRIW